jgi:hypothetical protein
MSIIAEVFVLASETLRQMRALTDVHQKIRTVESVIRLDLENRTIREVQPPVERKAGPDGVFGTADDYVLPIGIDPHDNRGYFMLVENSPADEQGDDTDDVIMLTTRLTATFQPGLAGVQPAYYGRAVAGSEPDNAFLPVSDGLAGSQEAEVIYFLRGGTLYRRVLLVGVPQPSDTYNPRLFASPKSWYSVYDISARPAPSGSGSPAWSIPIVNTLGALSYRSPRYGHRPPTYYDPVLNPPPAMSPPIQGGLSADFPGDPLFQSTGYSAGLLEFVDNQSAGPPPGTGYGLHGARVGTDQLDHNYNYPLPNSPLSLPELWFGRPTLRETSSSNWNYPDYVASTAWTDFNDNTKALYYQALDNTRTRPAEEALLTNVRSFDVKVFDSDSIPNGSTLPTGTFVDLGKFWPGAYPPVTAPGPTPSGGSLSGLPGYSPGPPAGPAPGTWPPARPVGVPVPSGRGFGAPFGYDSSSSPPYAIPPGVVPDLPSGMYRAPLNLAWTYDTWCTAYTKPTQAGVVPVAPPYIVPLRGIQIKIRFVEPETRLTREITIIQELR